MVISHSPTHLPDRRWCPSTSAAVLHPALPGGWHGMAGWTGTSAPLPGRTHSSVLSHGIRPCLTLFLTSSDPSSLAQRRWVLNWREVSLFLGSYQGRCQVTSTLANLYVLWDHVMRAEYLSYYKLQDTMSLQTNHLCCSSFYDTWIVM